MKLSEQGKVTEDDGKPLIYYYRGDSMWHLNFYHTAQGLTDTSYHLWNDAVRALARYYKTGRVERFS